MTPRSAMHERVRRVRPERRVLDGEHFGDRRPAPARSATPATPLPSTATLIGIAAGQLLRGGNRFPARAIELAVRLFGDDENHRTRASSRSRRTSSLRGLGRRAADHLRLLRLLRRQRQRDDLLRAAAGPAGGATFLISFFFAAMMPLSVA